MSIFNYFKAIFVFLLITSTYHLILGDKPGATQSYILIIAVSFFVLVLMFLIPWYIKKVNKETNVFIEKMDKEMDDFKDKVNNM